MTKSTGVFVSWIDFHGRSQELAVRLELSPVYITATGPALVRYGRQALRTWKLLSTERPEVVAVMLPPTPLLLVVRLFAMRRRTRILADFHTGAFLDRKWGWALTPSAHILRSVDAALVTNTTLAARLRRSTAARVEVVHDVIEPVDAAHRSIDDQARPMVLVPLSYAADEPTEEIVAAARLTPDLRWVLTGRAPADLRAAAPENVEFPGYIPRSDYFDLMDAATVFAAVTTREHTMQRVGYEALALGKPLVTTDFPELREFFSDAALYAAPTARALATTVRTAVSNQVELRASSARVRTERVRQQDTALSELADWARQAMR